MNDENNIDSFYKQLFGKAWYVIILVIVFGVLDTYLFPTFNKSVAIWSVISGVALKVFFIVNLSFKQLVKIIGQSHLLSHILVLFGFLIGLIIISFTMDFTALHLIDNDAFQNKLEPNSSNLRIVFEYLYLSTITFSSVGYGDIVPFTMSAKVVVMCEIALRFFVLVFGIANINQIRINKNS